MIRSYYRFAICKIYNVFSVSTYDHSQMIIKINKSVCTFYTIPTAKLLIYNLQINVHELEIYFVVEIVIG